MTLLQRIVEAPPSWRWHSSRVMSTVVYRRAFAAFGPGTVMVRPEKIKNPGQISIGAGGAIFEGLWLQAEGPNASISIGDRANFGRHVQIHAVDPITIGDACLVGYGSLISSGDHDYPDRSKTKATGPVVIGDNVFIGHGCVVLGGITIGDNATVGANAVVTRDVAPGQTVVGIPARPVGGQASVLDA